MLSGFPAGVDANWCPGDFVPAGTLIFQPLRAGKGIHDRKRHPHKPAGGQRRE